MATLPTPSINTTTWYSCIATCTNPGGGSTTITPSEFLVGNSVVSTVPYFEDFEGILVNNRLPNCSWYAQNLGTTVNSYVQANSNNRVARSGTKFGSFSTPSNNNTVYSNGITLYPGITYSAAIWYSTEYFGYSNWSELTMFVGPNQTSVGQVSIASTGPAISGPYKLLSGVFTVPAQTDYYICLRANGAAGSAPYLNFDDLSVTIPCDDLGAVNSPTLVTSFGVGPYCSGDILPYSASGANTYLWSNGDTNPSTSIVASTNTVISVVGTNTLTGCTANAIMGVAVNPAPAIFAFISKPEVCPGEITYLSAVGANSYAWSIGASAATASVIPSASTVYSVVGSSSNGCSATATVAVVLKTNPTVAASAARPLICKNEIADLTATGASTYKWYSSANAIVHQGATINVPLTTSTTFTLYGTGTNGCTGAITISQNVTECDGIEQVSQDGQFISVFPNPSSGIFTLKLSSGTIHKIVVTDMSGRVISEATAGSNEFSIDLSKLSAGVYFANVMDENSTRTIRLVRE